MTFSMPWTGQTIWRVYAADLPAPLRQPLGPLGLAFCEAGAGGDSITDCTTAATPAAAALADLSLSTALCMVYCFTITAKSKTSCCSFEKTANNTRTACACSAADQGGL